MQGVGSERDLLQKLNILLVTLKMFIIFACSLTMNG